MNNVKYILPMMLIATQVVAMDSPYAKLVHDALVHALIKNGKIDQAQTVVVHAAAFTDEEKTAVLIAAGYKQEVASRGYLHYIAAKINKGSVDIDENFGAVQFERDARDRRFYEVEKDGLLYLKYAALEDTPERKIMLRIDEKEMPHFDPATDQISYETKKVATFTVNPEYRDIDFNGKVPWCRTGW